MPCLLRKLSAVSAMCSALPFPDLPAGKDIGFNCLRRNTRKILIPDLFETRPMFSLEFMGA